MPPSDRPEAGPDTAKAPGGGPRSPTSISFSCRNLPSTSRLRKPVCVDVAVVVVVVVRGTGSSASSLWRCSIKAIFSKYRRVCHTPKYKVPAQRPPKKNFPGRFKPTTALLLLLLLLAMITNNNNHLWKIDVESDDKMMDESMSVNRAILLPGTRYRRHSFVPGGWEKLFLLSESDLHL